MPDLAYPPSAAQSAATDALKLPPHSLEAEQAVLGGLMLDNTAWDQIADIVNEDDFYRRDHRLIFRAIEALSNEGNPCDAVTLSEWLEKYNELDNAGGLAYLGNLARNTPTAANAKAYAEIVRERAVLRQLIHASNEISNLAFNPEGRNSNELLEIAEQRVFEIAERGARGRMGYSGIKQLLTKAVDTIDRLFQLDSPITGVPTGFKDFDEETAGLQNSDLIIVAGRPSMGKCIVSGSRLPDPHSGALVTIDEMVSQCHGDLLTLGDDFRLRRGCASTFVDDGVKPVYRVRTRSGREIETTLRHPFLTDRGWKPLGQLSAGDWIGVPRQIPVFGQEALPEHEIKLLAYFISDGGTTGASPAFTNSSVRVRDDFAEAVGHFPNVRCRLVKSGQRTPSLRVVRNKSGVREARERFGRRLQELMAAAGVTGRALANALGACPASISYWRRGVALPGSGQLQSMCTFFNVVESELMPHGLGATGQAGPNAVGLWLESHALRGVKATDKRVPEAVFRLPRRQLALFLNRLFTCDGSAYVQNETQAGFSYATASEGLAKDLRHLLLRFGIIAKLRHRTVVYNGERRRTFELRILHQQSIATFIDEIGIFAKEQAVERIRELVTECRRHSNVDLVPRSVWEHITALKGNRSWREIFEAHGLAVPSNLHVNRRDLSRERLALFARLFEDPYLHSLATSDVFWDPIEAIEYQGSKQVFDLSVPDTHNFVAEDVFVHNTTFAMNIAENAAIKHKVPVAVFSMEMPGEQLAMRMMSSLGHIDQHKIRTGKLSDDDWPRLTSAVGILSEAPLFIDDTPALTPGELRARARRIKREHGLGMIVVDYLQLMQAPAGIKENRATEISDISRGLKALAKELNVPVIALSQLNRSLEQRPNKRPVMSDLRESGAIEQDADVIVFIYRDEVYNDDSPDKGIAEIIIGKQRNGPIGTTRLTFMGQYTRFENYIHDVDYGEGYS